MRGLGALTLGMLVAIALGAAWWWLDATPPDELASLTHVAGRPDAGADASRLADHADAARDLVPPQATPDAPEPPGPDADGPFAGVDPALLEPLVLTGRVTLPGGEPLAGALVVHALGVEARARASASPDDVVDVLDPLHGDLLLADRLAALPHTRTAADGSFVLATRLVPDPRSLAQSDSWWSTDENSVDLLVQGDRLASARFSVGPLEPGARDVGPLVVEPGSSVVGRVVDEAGQPLAGVLVRASVRGAARDADVPGRSRFLPVGFDMALSGRDGRFTLPGLWTSQVRLTFSAPGRRELVRERVDLEAPGVVDLGQIELVPAGRASGTVRDAEGRPVPGATVYADANRRAGEEARVFLPDRSTRDDARCDARGGFDVALPGSGSSRLVAFAEGFGVGTSAEVASGARDVTIVLAAARDLLLELVDDGGAPLRDATVEAFRNRRHFAVTATASDDAGPAHEARDTPDAGAGDADGATHATQADAAQGDVAPTGSVFRIASVGDDLLEVIVRAPGGTSWHRRLDPVDPGEGPRRERLELPRKHVLTGRVVDGEGRPVADAVVDVVQDIDDWGEPGFAEEDEQLLRTDDEGRFRTHGLEPGDYWVSYGAQGFRPEQRLAEVDADEDLDLGDIPLAAAAVLRGRFVGGDDPRSRRCARLLFADDEVDGLVSDLGEFLFPRAPSGRVVLVAQPGVRLDLDLLPGEVRELEVALHRAPVVGGRVLDAAGAPVPGARVIARTSEQPVCVWGQAQAECDAEGRYSLTLPAAATWRIDASANGVTSEPVSLAVACDERGTLDIVLSASDELSGVVLDATSGAPLEGASVSLGRSRATSAADGTFTLVRPDGDATWRVGRDGYVMLRQAFVPDDAAPRLLLQPEARVDVSVVAPSGVPALDSTQVVLLRRGDDGAVLESKYGWVRNGRTHFARLAGGRYELLVPVDGASRSSWGDPSAARALQLFTLRDGEALEFVLNMR